MNIFVSYRQRRQSEIRFCRVAFPVFICSYACMPMCTIIQYLALILYAQRLQQRAPSGDCRPREWKHWRIREWCYIFICSMSQCRMRRWAMLWSSYDGTEWWWDVVLAFGNWTEFDVASFDASLIVLCTRRYECLRWAAAVAASAIVLGCYTYYTSVGRHMYMDMVELHAFCVVYAQRQTAGKLALHTRISIIFLPSWRVYKNAIIDGLS